MKSQLPFLECGDENYSLHIVSIAIEVEVCLPKLDLLKKNIYKKILLFFLFLSFPKKRKKNEKQVNHRSKRN